MSSKWISKSLYFFLAIPGFGVAAVPTLLQDATGITNPGVIEKRLQSDVVPAYQPSSAPIEDEVTKEKKAADAAAEKIHFTLTKVNFKDNTVFSDAQLEAIFSPSYHKKISLKHFQDLVSDVTKKYRSAGYVLSRAILPPQTIKNGVVQIQIIEGFISHVEVKGDPGLSRSLLELFGDRVRKIKPLQFHELERTMLLINDLPGLNVKAVITPSPSIPGSADLTLLVERKKYSAYASYDNYGTRYLGPQEIGAGISFYSVLFPGDSNSFRVVTVPETSRMQFYEFVHSQPIGINGTQLSLGTNYSNTKPGFNLKELEVIGRSFSIFGDLSHPFVRSRSDNFLMHVGGNYQNVTSTILGFPFYADRVRSITVGGKYDGLDKWRGINNLGIDMEQGLKIFGADQNIHQSRPKAIPSYTKFEFNLSRLQGLGSRFSLLAAFEGQYSFNPLVASEQFAYGGPEFGRGYDPAEIIGDQGFGGKLELRMDTAPSFSYLQNIQYYVFYDAGQIWNRDPITLPEEQSATSTGVGARIGFIPQVSGNVYIAKPLTLPVATTEAMGKNGNMFRVFFQIVANM